MAIRGCFFSATWWVEGYFPLSAYCWLVPFLAELIGQHSAQLWCLLEPKAP